MRRFVLIFLFLRADLCIVPFAVLVAAALVFKDEGLDFDFRLMIMRSEEGVLDGKVCLTVRQKLPHDH